MVETNRTSVDLGSLLADAVARIQAWEDEWGSFDRHEALAVDPKRLGAAWAQYTERLRGNYPFFHPRYAGQMLKPPHPVAVLGYLAAMLINPNNHALDGGPPTAEMEKEVVRRLAAMVRLPDDALGHLTTSGTLANLEALWVARQLHPEKIIAYSTEAHYTHARMGDVLGLEGQAIPSDPFGRMDLDALEARLRSGRIGTVVLTAGTTGLGAVDPIDEALELAERYGCRIHVDAAYGGFYALLAWTDKPDVPAGPFRAISKCDSVAIDPHKHGLQPYGCGCVLFRDPSVGRFYKHDSPYTYFTSADLHLGEISLECSRAGAAAGALWFTLQCLPLNADDGLGPVLKATRRAACRWADWIERSDLLWLFQRPELDIVTFFPKTRPATLAAVDTATQRVFEAAMQDEEHPVFLSVLRVSADKIQHRAPSIGGEGSSARILRSVLMKPEHEAYAAYLHEHVERHAVQG